MRFIFLILLIFSSLSAKSSVDEINGLKLGMSYEDVIIFLKENNLEVDQNKIEQFDFFTNYSLKVDEQVVVKSKNNPPKEVTIKPLKENNLNLGTLDFCEDKGKLIGIAQVIHTNDIQDFLNEIIFLEKNQFRLSKDKLIFSVVDDEGEDIVQSFYIKYINSNNDVEVFLRLKSNKENANKYNFWQHLFNFNANNSIVYHKNITLNRNNHCLTK